MVQRQVDRDGVGVRANVQRERRPGAFGPACQQCQPRGVLSLSSRAMPHGVRLAMTTSAGKLSPRAVSTATGRPRSITMRAASSR